MFSLRLIYQPAALSLHRCGRNAGSSRNQSGFVVNRVLNTGLSSKFLLFLKRNARQGGLGGIAVYHDRRDDVCTRNRVRYRIRAGMVEYLKCSLMKNERKYYGLDCNHYCRFYCGCVG